MLSSQKEIFDSYGARVSKPLLSGQTQTRTSFYMACELRTVFSFYMAKNNQKIMVRENDMKLKFLYV